MALPKFFTPPLSDSVAPASTVSVPLPVNAPPLQLLLPVNSRLPEPCRLPPDSVSLAVLAPELKLAVPPEIDTLLRFCAVPPPAFNEPPVAVICPDPWPFNPPFNVADPTPDTVSPPPRVVMPDTVSEPPETFSELPMLMVSAAMLSTPVA